jgi:DNA invertase Pin-like site-specific DNA recombinase
MSYLDGGRWALVDEFTEIESGKRNDRPELVKALEPAKSRKPSSSLPSSIVSPEILRLSQR